MGNAGSSSPSGWAKKATTGPSVYVNAWAQIAFSYNGTKDELTTYINGVSCGLVTIGTNYYTTNGFWIIL